MVNIAAYAEMAIRTANKRAYLQGEGTKRAEWGVHTVLVPNRGGGCPYCIKFQGKVFIDDVWSGGTEAESKLLENIVTDEKGYILCNEKQETSVDKIYACGDTVKKNVYQIVTAAAEGAIAALDILKRK